MEDTNAGSDNHSDSDISESWTIIDKSAENIDNQCPVISSSTDQNGHKRYLFTFFQMSFHCCQIRILKIHRFIHMNSHNLISNFFVSYKNFFYQLPLVFETF